MFVRPNMPLAKGPVTLCLDQVSVRADARSLLETLRAEIITLGKSDYKDLADVLGDRLMSYVYADPQKVMKVVDYLKEHWFSVDTGAWPHYQPIAPVYALGLLKALNASLNNDQSQPTPIDSYWLVGYSGVELITMSSTRQVTLVIATPAAVQIWPSGIWGEESQAWATTWRSGAVDVEVDPTDNDLQVPPGQTHPRVCTYKIVSGKT